MAQQSQQMLDPFEQLKVTRAQKDKLVTIDKKRQEFEENSAQTLDQYAQTTNQILEGKAQVEDLSLLEVGIQRGKQCNMEVYQIAENIAITFENLGQLIGDTQNYKGWWEKGLANVGLTKVASKVRIKRIRSAGVRHNLETVLDFGHFGVHKINEMILANQECYQRMGGIIRKIGEDLKEIQPVYEKWRADREGYERQMKELKGKQSQVVGQEFADLEVERAALQEKLDGAQYNESNFFAIVERAKQAAETLPIHQQSYRDAVSALNQIKVRLEKDIEYYTPAFLSAQTMIETGVTTKSTSQYYRGLRMALDSTTETVQKISAGIMDEAASIAEKPALDIQRRKLLRDAQIAERMRYDSRMAALEQEYSTPSTAPPAAPGQIS